MLTKTIRFALALLSLSLFATRMRAQTPANGRDSSSEDVALDSDFNEADRAASELENANSGSIRRFHEVLDDLLAEFGYDVKLNQLKGLKNLAVRKVEVSDAIPSTYRKYMELLILERIRENSKIKLITCVPCSSKTSKMIDGKIVITSPSTNVGELRTAAERLNIDNFMDIILVYHSTHMVLAMQIFNSSTNELMWSRTYNSETIRSRYQKLAIDYKQVAKSRPGEDYQAEYRILFGLGGAAMPNVAGGQLDNTMIDLAIRGTEKFDNRRSEFGMQMNIYVTLASVLNEYPKVGDTGVTPLEEAEEEPTAEELDFEIPAQPEPFTFALGLYGIYSKNFLGAVESYNNVRTGVHLAVGAMLTTGYLAASLKFGVDLYFGRRFTFTASGIYVAPSQITLDEAIIETQGGVGGEGVVSYNF